jgi:Mn-dependent DtxR family transcriptional regulator
MRANLARGVPNTQDILRRDLCVSQPRVSEIIREAISRGYVTGADVIYGGSRCYLLTTEGKRYADEQTQGAGP